MNVVIYVTRYVVKTKFYKKGCVFMNEKNEIILFENQGVKLEVNLKDENGQIKY